MSQCLQIAMKTGQKGRNRRPAQVKKRLLWDYLTKMLNNGNTHSLQEESNIEEVQTWTTNGFEPFNTQAEWAVGVGKTTLNEFLKRFREFEELLYPPLEEVTNGFFAERLYYKVGKPTDELYRDFDLEDEPKDKRDIFSFGITEWQHGLYIVNSLKIIYTDIRCPLSRRSLRDARRDRLSQ